MSTMERLFWIAKNIMGGVVGPPRAANLVLAGPASGGAANPTFRGLAGGDLPSGQISQGSAGNPTPTSSLTFVMMGVGSTLTVHPTIYTRAHVTVTCQIANSVASDGAIARLRYGTGTAPVNGAAETGTQIGQLQAILNNANTAGLAVPCTMVGIMTGLTPGTTYWVDVALESLTGGSSSIINTEIVAFEFP